MSKQTNFAAVFLQEAEELLATIEEKILDVENDPTDAEAVNGLFRAMHTIKGSGAMFGFDELSRFTHHVETALDLVRSEKLKVTKQLIDLTLASRDQIKAMLDEAKGIGKASRTTAQEIVDAFVRLAPNDKRMTTAPSSVLETRPSILKQESTYRIHFTPNIDIFTTGMDPALVLEELRALGECNVTVHLNAIPSLTQLTPTECYLSFDVILSTKHDLADIQDVFIFVEDGSKVSIEKIDLSADENVPMLGEILVDRGVLTKVSIENALKKQERLGNILTADGAASGDQIKAALAEQQLLKKKKDAILQEAVKVPAEKLDRLVNLVGELVIIQSQLQITAGQSGQSDLSSQVEEVGRLTGELRDIALNIRMMPIGTTFSRFRRLVRDLSSELGKQVTLATYGEDTEMDKTVIDRLGDPLVHLIRNCMDHGIESPDVRITKGKPPHGTISLSARHKGARIVVSVEDDGKGLDADAIRKKAVEKGLIEESTKLTQAQTFDLIMEPGFSTAEKVSAVSGRGVGMDVVKREITALRGTIDIRSTKDQGTVINLNLPLTLAIIEGLMVNVGSSKFIIPVSLVEECLELDAGNHSMDNQRNLLTLRGALIPYIRLRDVFYERTPSPTVEEAVIVENGSGTFGIVVDHVIGQHQTVIKTLGPMYRHTHGLSGATILGDGSVALIVDVNQIIQIADAQEVYQVNAKRQLRFTEHSAGGKPVMS